MPETDDEGAFRRFFDEHHADLSRLAYLVTGETQVADDLASDAFVEVWRHWARVCAADSPIAYARGIVTNLARQWIRKQTRDRAGLLRLGLLRRDRGETDTPAILDVRAALRRLPLRRRECVILRYAFDVPEKEVAAILGISLGAVKSHTSRGAAQLSEFLREMPLTTGGHHG
ncbi:RNA polymerase sigma factor [Actinoplanes sp. SE50]|uniref:SigE family RNA polymerase sigma factor n=1 Tax=unclassified Actinoplanes TaxID=2626549 RepID=UPI00023ECC32|nr:MULTISPECIES: SigE family RNA polymerase sigma factor [unclassified Actinoplanes]AEV82094.1 RNA polymerase sigma factor sigZ [Actinoplanes sp. SE50/110]ATO80493.1 RNA polymerase sigma factor [Actinoplanes sp. SE50]SLL97900.1 RNA polymerase sigma factor [Actinoplanes sp. SE50/110]